MKPLTDPRLVVELFPSILTAWPHLASIWLTSFRTYVSPSISTRQAAWDSYWAHLPSSAIRNAFEKKRWLLTRKDYFPIRHLFKDFDEIHLKARHFSSKKSTHGNQFNLTFVDCFSMYSTSQAHWNSHYFLWWIHLILFFPLAHLLTIYPSNK
jgi:hypothetical protein